MLRYRSSPSSPFLQLSVFLKDQLWEVDCGFLLYAGKTPAHSHPNEYGCSNNLQAVGNSRGLQICADHSWSQKLNVAVRVTGHPSSQFSQFTEAGQEAIFTHRGRCLMQIVSPPQPSLSWRQMKWFQGCCPGRRRTCPPTTLSALCATADSAPWTARVEDTLTRRI